MMRVKQSMKNNSLVCQLNENILIKKSVVLIITYLIEWFKGGLKKINALFKFMISLKCCRVPLISPINLSSINLLISCIFPAFTFLSLHVW